MPRRGKDEVPLSVERILNEAYQVFAEEGYEGTSLNLLAQRLKVSKPALYYYFSSKERLFEALYDAVSARIVDDVQTICAAADGRAFRDVIVDLGMNDFSILETEPNLLRVLRQFDLLCLKLPSLQERAKAMESKIAACHKQLMAYGVRTNVIAPERHDVYQRMITGLINGLSYEMITTGRVVTEQEWRWMVDAILK